MNVYRSSIKTGGQATQQDAVERLLLMYRNDPNQFTSEQKKKIARLAFETGNSFDVESKPISKGLFDLVDTAALGMIPNTWRPSSIGQEYFGESGIDKFAGGLGTAAGIVPGLFTGGALIKGGAKLAKGAPSAYGKAKGSFDAWRGGKTASSTNNLGKAVSNAKEKMAKARAKANAEYYKGYNQANPANPYRPMSGPTIDPNAPLQLGQGRFRNAYQQIYGNPYSPPPGSDFLMV